jgi:hypothetical protein
VTRGPIPPVARDLCQSPCASSTRVQYRRSLPAIQSRPTVRCRGWPDRLRPISSALRSAGAVFAGIRPGRGRNRGEKSGDICFVRSTKPSAVGALFLQERGAGLELVGVRESHEPGERVAVVEFATRLGLSWRAVRSLATLGSGAGARPSVPPRGPVTCEGRSASSPIPRVAFPWALPSRIQSRS